jgi:hypothetical protein
MIIADIKDISSKGIDASFEKIEYVKMKHSNVGIYRADGGATTDFGIVIRQELSIVPGILLVKNLYDRYHMSDATYKIIDDGTISIVMTDGVESEKKKFELKRFVYF